MKNISKLIFLSSLLAIAFWSCQKDEIKDYYQGGTAPVLKSSLTGSIPLSYANAANQAISFSWTNPNYQFTTGVSSQNVNYILEIDTTGSNFTNPNKQSISVSQDLSLAISVGTFNDYLLNQLVLKPEIPHNLDIRVKSTLVNGTVVLISNVLKFTVTPYTIPPKVNPPATGTLYLVGGDAKLGVWQNGGSYAVQNQQFTKVSTTLYQITVQLSGGDNTTDKDQYLFVPKWGDWGHKFACAKTSAQPETGGDFGYDWSDNFPGPTAAGTYLIQVDFQRGKYTVTKQ